MTTADTTHARLLMALQATEDRVEALPAAPETTEQLEDDVRTRNKLIMAQFAYDQYMDKIKGM